MSKYITMLLSSMLLCVGCINAQTEEQEEQTEQLPYYEIPDYPEEYTAGTMAARMIDGLGFRFYWATEGLKEEDLEFRPGSEVRSTEETVDHIYGMSIMIRNAILKESEGTDETLTFEEKRAAVLNNLMACSEVLLVSSAQEINTYKVRVSDDLEFPFWNLVNGPIADCIWHCGQIASFRRSSGNPFNSNVSVFNGKLRQ